MILENCELIYSPPNVYSWHKTVRLLFREKEGNIEYAPATFWSQAPASLLEPRPHSWLITGSVFKDSIASSAVLSSLACPTSTFQTVIRSDAPILRDTGLLMNGLTLKKFYKGRRLINDLKSNILIYYVFTFTCIVEWSPVILTLYRWWWYVATESQQITVFIIFLNTDGNFDMTEDNIYTKLQFIYKYFRRLANCTIVFFIFHYILIKFLSFHASPT